MIFNRKTFWRDLENTPHVCEYCRFHFADRPLTAVVDEIFIITRMLEFIAGYYKQFAIRPIYFQPLGCVWSASQCRHVN